MTAPQRRVSGREIRLKTIGILAGVAIAVAATSFVMRYRAVIHRVEQQMLDLVQSQARVIEAVAKYDAIHAAPGDNFRANTLSQVREAQYAYQGIGRTGELVLGERRDSMIHFLLPEPSLDYEVPPPVPWGGALAQPMTRATAGASGVMLSTDYRGERVIAAYAYLPFLDAGLVAKVDVAEVRAPLVRAGIVTIAVGIIAILVGILLHGRLVGPLVSRVLKSHDTLEIGLRSEGARSERYATVFKSAADPIIIEDLDGVVVELNRAAEESYGWSADELVGQPIKRLAPPDQLTHYDDMLARCLRGDEVRNEQAVRMTKDGTRLTVLVTLSGLRDADGTVVAVSSVAKDVTDLMQAKQRVEEYSRSLEERVKERTEQLEHELRVARTLAVEARRGHEVALLGDSIQVRALREQIQRFAASDEPLLLGGPPGSGQESVARAIHDDSPRADRPLIVVDCSRPLGDETTPLLGITHDTDAGKVAVADGGSIYLDLVAFLPQQMQQTLARFLRQSAATRAQGERPHPDVRVIAYLAADLNQAVSTGELHPELAEVLGRRRLTVPSLSERSDDIEPIALHMLQNRARAMGKQATSFSERALRRLQEHTWPGNLRELQSVVERALLTTIGAVVDIEEDLRQHVRSVGGYRLLRSLGRGGMGEVWFAEHALLKRPAAIKLTQTDPDMDPERRAMLEKRFRREAEVTSKLRSPHTVELYDFGVTDDGQFYYVMEYMEGYDLASLLSLEGPLPPERVLSFVRQACLSLIEAHQAGLVHRDIKPENLFACRMGTEVDFLKVLDFGVVKQARGDDTSRTGTGVIVGTPAYVAPELASSEKPTPQSDIYALGCVLYRLLTGKHVFDADSVMSMIIAHLEQTPVRPSERASQPIPPELDDLILACLAKDPAHRPASVIALREALAAIPVAEPWTEERAAAWWKGRMGAEVDDTSDVSTMLLRRK